MNALELKVPPPLVALGTGFGMWRLARSKPRTAPVVPRFLRLGAATALAVCGGAMVVTGVRSFRRQQTTISPFRPGESRTLVTHGIYGVTRNPMYLGMLTTLLGWAAWLGSPQALLGPPAFFLYITRFQIVPEERILTGVFGADFTAYTARVRRWL